MGKVAYADKSHISNGGNRRIELNLGEIRGFLSFALKFLYLNFIDFHAFTDLNTSKY